jgi:Ni/Fe-hydrogenase subunit HybB-like protein
MATAPTRRLELKSSPFAAWIAFLAVLCGVGLAAGILVFVKGLSVTGLSDRVPWGLWITVDLSAIGLGAGAFLLSAAVYLLGLKRYEPVARLAVFVGLLGYTSALLMLLLDIWPARPLLARLGVLEHTFGAVGNHHVHHAVQRHPDD